MKLRHLDAKHVAFWGAGMETRSLAGRLEQLGVRPASTVLLVDDVEAAGDDFPADDLASGPEIDSALANVDIVLRSPIVNAAREELVRFRARGGAVTTPTGVWVAEYSGQVPLVGVSGTKGKSTSAALVAHLFGESGHRTELAGNIGRSVWEIEDPRQLDSVVLELSSYQMLDMPVSPETLLITNAFPEHLDWHGGSTEYFAAKFRLAQLPGVRTVLNPAAAEQAREHWPATFTAFGSQGDFTTDGRDVLSDGEPVLRLGELSAPGAHNLVNLCGALTALRVVGIEVDDVRAATAGFRSLRDRLEVVADHDGVRWVCDQMHASPEAVVAAVETFGSSSERLILIIGGRYRGQPHETVARLMHEHPAIEVICVEESGVVAHRELLEAGVEKQRLAEFERIEQAVAHAAAGVGPGDTVIFCPMAPIRDFRPPPERSREFRAALATQIGGAAVTP